MPRHHPQPDPIPPGFKRAVPVSTYFAALGKFYVRETPGQPPVWGIHVRHKHGNRYGTGHGGFIATLADTHMAGFVHHNFPGMRVVTTDLKVKYIRPAYHGSWLEGHQVEVKREGDYGLVVCDLIARGELVARCTGRFKLTAKT